MTEAVICKTLQRLDLIRKKDLAASEQDRPDVTKRHAEWRAEQPGLGPGKLIFINETWVRTNMTCSPGRSQLRTTKHRLKLFRSNT